MILWFTGQPASGKTTLAQRLRELGLIDFIIDGDQLRAVQPTGYDERGRHENIARAQDIALYLHMEGKRVAVALVSPYRAQRDWLKARSTIFEVFLHTSEDRGRSDYHVDHEAPIDPLALSLDTGALSINECIERIRAHAFL